MFSFNLARYPLMLLGFAMMYWHALPAPVQASEGGIRLNQTRVVFNQNEKNTATTITNNSQTPYLVKAWVSASPTGADVAEMPFAMTPPLFRLDAENKHTVLIVKQGHPPLPVDRESVFYLNFLAIPASQRLDDLAGNDVAAKISIGIQTTIKLYFRPTTLPMTAADAADKLTFTRTSQGVAVKNPTPYYITFAQLFAGNTEVPMRHEDAMVAPYSTQQYTLPSGSTNTVSWQAITDYGGLTDRYQAPLRGAKP